MSPKLRRVLADNLAFLMEARGLSEQGLSDLTGGEVAQKTINNLKNQRQAATLDTIELLAHALKIDHTLLLQEGLEADVVGTPSVSKLFSNYIRASGEGRQTIQRVAETEALYAPKKAS